MNTLKLNLIITFSLLMLSQLALANVSSGSKGISLLFVQSAPQLVLQPMQKNSQQYQLILRGLGKGIHYFSDKPVRDSGLMTYKAYTQLWQHNKLNQASRSPNAAINVYNEIQHKTSVYVFELSHPSFDAKKNEMQYQARLISKTKPTATQFDHAALYIDGIHWHGNKFGHH